MRTQTVIEPCFNTKKEAEDVIRWCDHIYNWPIPVDEGANSDYKRCFKTESEAKHCADNVIIVNFICLHFGNETPRIITLCASIALEMVIYKYYQISCIQTNLINNKYNWIQNRQPNKIMAYLTFHKWLVSVCNIHNDIWMEQTKTSHLGKVSYAILLGWRNIRFLDTYRNLDQYWLLILLNK